jgi:uncharacterized protein with LGFP repeats
MYDSFERRVKDIGKEVQKRDEEKKKEKQNQGPAIKQQNTEARNISGVNNTKNNQENSTSINSGMESRRTPTVVVKENANRNDTVMNAKVSKGDGDVTKEMQKVMETSSKEQMSISKEQVNLTKQSVEHDIEMNKKLDKLIEVAGNTSNRQIVERPIQSLKPKKDIL